MHRLGANQSEKARKEIEKEFKLIRAQGSKNKEAKIIPVNASKVIYGKSEIKRAISNVLMLVLDQYKFSSFPELNAILSQYNVAAEKGEPGSRMHEKNGLVYRVLDENGNKVGTAIKASLFYMKPTLKMLEHKFKENELFKEPLKKRIQTIIGWVLLQEPRNLKAFINALQLEGIGVVVRKGKENIIYGLTYIDHKNRVVFNGSDLGKQYSAKSVMESLSISREINTKEKYLEHSRSEIYKQFQESVKDGEWKIGPVLPEAIMPYEPIPFTMKIKKKHRKKRHIKF